MNYATMFQEKVEEETKAKQAIADKEAIETNEDAKKADENEIRKNTSTSCMHSSTSTSTKENSESKKRWASEIPQLNGTSLQRPLKMRTLNSTGSLVRKRRK